MTPDADGRSHCCAAASEAMGQHTFTNRPSFWTALHIPRRICRRFDSQRVGLAARQSMTPACAGSTSTARVGNYRRVARDDASLLKFGQVE
jgi:hypothetical protein